MRKHKLDKSCTGFRSEVKRLRWAVLLVVVSAVCPAQELSPSRVLTLDAAIRLAVANNRSLKIASLEVDKSKWQVAEVKTKRLPSFSGSVLGSQLLKMSVSTFPRERLAIFRALAHSPRQTQRSQLRGSRLRMS